MNILVTFLIVLMGISCFSGQVLFIREFLILFNGNELIIGLILANWLLLQAAGSFIGGIISLRLRSPRNTYSLTLLATGILFPLSIMAARTAKTLAHAAPGQEIGIVAIMFTSLLIMAPLGMFLGGQFPLICRLSQDTRNQSLITATGKSYFWEAIGFGLGGIMITYILIAHTNALYSAFFIGWSNILAAGMLVFANRKKPAAGFGIIILAIAGIIGYQYPAETADRLSLRWQWKSLNIVDSQNSAYGNISVINQREQHTFYYDGAPFMSLPLPDIRFIRDIVSFPLAAVIAPDKVAVIGSGLGGIIDTILQFPVQRVDYAEIDPLIIIMARRYSTETTRRELADKRLIIHHHDGRLFLRNTPERFDVIIMNLPPPATLILNRYYTREFFQLVKQHLSPQGILCFPLPGTISYLSDEQIDINKCILETLRSVFTGVDVIPGEPTLYLAGNGPAITLTPETTAKALQRYGVNNPLFTPTYLRDRLDPELKTWFYASLDKRSVKSNTDLEPNGVHYSIALWRSLVQSAEPNPAAGKIPGVMAGILSAIIIISLISAKKQKQSGPGTGVLFLVLTSGFTGIGENLILLLCLQIFHGYAFLHIGLLIGSFMLGLTSGSGLMTGAIERKENNLHRLLFIDAAFGTSCLLLYPFIRGVHELAQTQAPLGWTLLLLSAASIICGFFIGLEFPLANKIYLGSRKDAAAPANILYAWDMLGSFGGAITVSVVLIPRLGMLTTVLIIAAIKLITCALVGAGFFATQHD